MGLFDGMGFGDGYNHSSSRGFMRSDYITGTGRGPVTKAEVYADIFGVVLLSVAVGYMCTIGPRETKKENHSQYYSGSIANYDATMQRHFRALEEFDSRLEKQDKIERDKVLIDLCNKLNAARQK